MRDILWLMIVCLIWFLTDGLYDFWIFCRQTSRRWAKEYLTVEHVSELVLFKIWVMAPILMLVGGLAWLINWPFRRLLGSQIERDMAFVDSIIGGS